MEGPEGALNRVSRAVWTVWGYITGAVGRYLRPEVRNEEAQNVHHKQEIRQSYKELKLKVDGKNSPGLKRNERKTRDDLQFSGVSVRDAAFQWEKGNIAHSVHEVKVNSKPTYTGLEGIDKKSQMEKDIETMSDDQQIGKSVFSDVDEKNQDKTFSGSELNVESEVSNQKLKNKPEEKDKFLSINNDESEAELKSEFIEQDADLNVKSGECGEKQKRKEEDDQGSVDQTFIKDIEENKKEGMKSSFTDERLLAKEFRDENYQEEKWQSKKEDEEAEDNSINSVVVGKKAAVKENIQEQRKEQKEEEKDGEKIVKGKDDETRLEQFNVKLIDLGLLTKDDYQNVDKMKNEHEQRSIQEERGVGVTLEIYNDKSIYEPFTGEFIDQDMTKILNQNGECRENNEGQGKKEEKEGEKIMQRKIGETHFQNNFIEHTLLSEEVELNVEKDENNQEQKRISQKPKEDVGRTLRKEHKKELIKSHFPDQGKVAKEAELNVEMSKEQSFLLSQEQKKIKEEECLEIMREKAEAVEELTEDADVNVKRNKDNQEPEKAAEEAVKLLKRNDDDDDDDKTVKETVICEFPVPTLTYYLSTKDGDIRSKHNQDHKNKQNEEEEGGEQNKHENDKSIDESIASESIEQGLTNKFYLYVKQIKKEDYEDVKIREHEKELIDRLLTTEADLRILNNQEHSEEDEDDLEIINDVDDAVEDTTGSDFNVESNENSQECIEIVPREDNESKEKTIKSEFIERCLPANNATLSDDTSKTMKEQTKKVEEREEIDEILWTEYEKSNQEKRKPEEKEKRIKIMRENDTTEKNQGLFKKQDDLEQKSKQEEEVDGDEDQDLLAIQNKLALKEQTFGAPTENETSKAQTADTLFIQLASTWDKRDAYHQGPINQILQPSIEKPENATLQNITSDVGLNVESSLLVDADHNSSQKTSIMTKQEVEVVNNRPKTGNQTESVETTSQFKAAVAAVDMKKSAQSDISLHEQLDRDDVAVEKIIDKCLSKQESLLKRSANKKTTQLCLHKGQFSEVKFERVDETAVVQTLDAIQMQKLDESSNKVEATLSSSNQAAVVFSRLSEVSGMSQQAQPKNKYFPVEETTLEDQMNQNYFTLQYSPAKASSLFKSSYLIEIESKQKTLDHSDLLKDTDEQMRTVSADPELSDEVKNVTPSLGVQELITWISGPTKDSEETDCELLRESEAAKRKQGDTNKLESLKETSETNRDVKDAARECEIELKAKITDFENIVVATGWEMESENKQSIHLEGENFGRGESVTDRKENIEERVRSRMKREFDKILEDSEKSKTSVLPEFYIPAQASALDLTILKSKIAVKNPRIRPPKDPRTLINMVSVEPLTPHPLHPSQPSFLKKSHIECASMPSKSVIGFKFPGLDSGLPALRKTEAERKMWEGDCCQNVPSQKTISGLQAADEHVKQQAALSSKPKWTTPRQPGVGGPLMLAELQQKLKKPAEE